uniref:J domain-containing protein n=1 Tax=Ananas comosus var. bracteatus TaxID=296719 RepID=A0A6V7QBA1_ANACO|nr:unnamed protein product [Ananas comosus var. bracteatus]
MERVLDFKGFNQYHPDVCGDLQAAEVFKSINSAYEVLSDETSRAEYNMTLQFPRQTERPDLDARRNYRWSELRRKTRYRKQKKYDYSWYYQRYYSREASTYERRHFGDVLIFAFFTLFFVQTIGCRAALTICGITALLDNRLDTGYKIGYVIAWILGGRGGVLLTLCIRFASWLCGKNSSGMVALVVVAMWVGASLARFAPLPHGAVLTLLYMSIKLQVDLK